MFGDDFRLAAVLDWDQMCLADPRHDLAWWLYFDRMYTEGMGIPRPAGMGDGKDTLQLWEELTGLKAGDLSWYEAYLVYKLSMISMKTFAAAGQPAEAAAKHGKDMINRLRAQLDIG
jgi:aminoglycoside phosphotransferase (APT) family kinase protein